MIVFFLFLDSNISLNKKTPKIDRAFCEFYKKNLSAFISRFLIFASGFVTRFYS
ncbi:hypothetical protein MCEGE10_02723 [Flavobacteriaceae bacterium]